MGDDAKLAELGLGNIHPRVIASLISDNKDAKGIDLVQLKRLIRAPEDEPSLVQKRFAVWTQTQTDIEDNFAGNIYHVDSSTYSIPEMFHKLQQTILGVYQ